jgi:short-subunit dehydrogenase
MNVLISGATKGIGRAVTEIFARHGASVAICARNSNDLQLFSEYLQATYKVQVLTYACDVSVAAEVKAFGEFVKGHWQQVDVLINNAGFFAPGQVINEADGRLESQINTNLYSAYHLSRSVLPLMLPHRSGHIFNICSIASLKAYPNGGSYSISKFAMLGLSKALREELKEHNIRVTSVMPGAVLTASWEGVDLPESRFIDVEDIASLVYNTHSLSNRTVVEDIVIRPMLGDI